MTRIAGIGVDTVSIDRVRRHVTANPAFSTAAFTPQELAHSGGHPDRLAGRWAAKEAVMKALGVGLGTVDPHDVEILETARGRPYVRLRRAAAATGVVGVQVTISYDGTLAVAFAVAEEGTS